jgi:RNA polymerase sigma-70 factor (sigma-E family)
VADRDGFDAYVRADSARLLQAAYGFTRDRQHAEDLVQAALAKAWVAWPRIEGDPGPYVLRTLTTTYVSWWRRRSWHEPPVADVPDRSAAPDSSADHVDLWDALGRLPRRQRAVVVLRYVLDLPEHAVADALGIAPGTVKSQASKGLAHLRLDPSIAPSQEVWL